MIPAESGPSWPGRSTCSCWPVVAGTAGYYLLSASRLTERIEGIDEIFAVDVACGILLILLLLEGVRRAVGWSLLSVLIIFLGLRDGR